MGRVITTLVMSLLSIAIVALIELVIRGLKAHKSWAWVLSIILGGIYFFSIYLPLGAIILWGVLSKESKVLFRKT